jgi:hypothetical protein
MPVRRIQIGQMWKKDETGETFLVTKLYNEVLSTMAVLRKTGEETSVILRVKVEREGDGQTLRGFSFAQPSDES